MDPLMSSQPAEELPFTQNDPVAGGAECRSTGHAASRCKEYGMKRGLTYSEALDYVGIKRRTFDSQWRPHLVAISQGTSLIFDRADLDRLFEAMKVSARAGGPPAVVHSDLTISLLPDRRPTPEKGVEKWVVKTASTKTQMAGGGSTSSTAVNAFRAVSNRIRKPKLG